MQDLLDTSLVSGWPFGLSAADLAVDVYEQDDSFIVKVGLPGVKPEDVNVTMVGNTLTVEAETRVEEKVEEKDYIRRERRQGKLTRSVTLPTDASADKIEAELENGLLTLTVPKSERAKTHKVAVRGK